MLHKTVDDKCGGRGSIHSAYSLTISSKHNPKISASCPDRTWYAWVQLYFRLTSVQLLGVGRGVGGGAELQVWVITLGFLFTLRQVIFDS